MQNLELFLYGAILGHFIIKGIRKLSPRVLRYRFAVVAQHCSRNEMVLVGRTNDPHQFSLALQMVEETLEYINIGYDLSDSQDRIEFSTLRLVDYDDLDSPHKFMLGEARALCQ